MMERTRLLASLLASGLLASCGGSSNDLAFQKDAHVLEECKGWTPGFWCGGASTATPDDCTAVGFANCDEMCLCFHEANARKGATSSTACGMGACQDGMADVLRKFYAAFQLSFDTNDEFYCPAAECGPENLCDTADMQEILSGCDRDRQEAAKNCIDTILNTGGVCSFLPGA